MNQGVIHKPRGQLRGRGVSQMAILSQKPYLVKVTTKGGGGSKIPKILTTWFMDDPLGMWRNEDDPVQVVTFLLDFTDLSVKVPFQLQFFISHLFEYIQTKLFL